MDHREWGFRFLVRAASPPLSPWAQLEKEPNHQKVVQAKASQLDGAYCAEYEVVQAKVTCWRLLNEDTHSKADMELERGETIFVCEKQTKDKDVWLKIDPEQSARKTGDEQPLSEAILYPNIGEKTSLTFDEFTLEQPSGRVFGSGKDDKDGNYKITTGTVEGDPEHQNLNFECKFSKKKIVFTGTITGREISGTYTQTTFDNPPLEHKGHFVLSVPGIADKFYWVRELDMATGEMYVALKTPKVKEFHVKVEGAQISEIMFDDESKLPSGMDWITLVTPQPSSSRSRASSSLQTEQLDLSPPLSGYAKNTQLPKIGCPYVVRAGEFTLKYFSRCSETLGFSLIAKSANIDEKAIEYFNAFKVDSAHQVCANEVTSKPGTNEDGTTEPETKEFGCQWHKMAVDGAFDTLVVFSPESNLKDGATIRFFYQDPRQTGDDQTQWNPFRQIQNSKELPGINGNEPLEAAKEFWVCFKTAEGLDWESTWRLVACDKDKYQQKQRAIEKDDPLKNKAPPTYVPFFENKSDDIQTIRVNMPVYGGKAYYEVAINRDCTTDSFLIAGWCAPKATIIVSERTAEASGYCLGLGSSVDSLGIDGMFSMRYFKGDTTTIPSSPCPLKAGDILGVLMDFDKKKVSYYVNGTVKASLDDTDGVGKWGDKGMMPAVSFHKGQSFVLSCREKMQFLGIPEQEREGAKWVEEAANYTYISERWNIYWGKWQPVTLASQLWEDFNTPEVKEFNSKARAYLRDLVDLQKKQPRMHLKGLKRFEGALTKAEEEEEKREHETTQRDLIPSKGPMTLEVFLQKFKALNEGFERILLDKILARMNDLNIGYKEDMHKNQQGNGSSINKRFRGSSRGQPKPLLRKKTKFQHDLVSHMLDLGVAEMFKILQEPWNKYIETQNLQFNKELSAAEEKAKSAFSIFNSIKDEVTEALEDAAEVVQDALDIDDAEEDNEVQATAGAADKKKEDTVQFKEMITSVISKQNIEENPSAALVLAKTLMVLGKEYIHSKQNEFEKIKKKPDEIEEMDEFSTPIGKKALAAVQELIGTKLSGAVLVRNLICYSSSQQIHHEAFYFGNFLLRGMNQKTQTAFIEIFKKDNMADQMISSIGEHMSYFITYVTTFRGKEKLYKIEEMRTVLVFLQNLCDGQFTPFQDMLSTCKIKQQGAQDITLLELSVKIMEALAKDLEDTMVWTVDIDQLIYILNLAEQTFSALADFIQGPHHTNQEILFAAKIIPAAASWWKLLQMLSKRSRKTICSKLPGVQQLARMKTSLHKKRDNYIEKAADKEKGKDVNKIAAQDLELFETIRAAEYKLMVLIRSEIEQNKNKNDVTIECVKQLEPLALLDQLRYHWVATIFQKKHLKRSKKTKRRRMLECLTHIKNAFEGKCAKELADPDKLKSLHVREFEELGHGLQLAAFQKKEEQEIALELAFEYYVLLEGIIDYHNNQNATAALEDENIKNKLILFNDMWLNHKVKNPKTVIPYYESKYFERYFGSIEVIGSDKQLHRIYFPIPRDCREQITNPLVKAERKNLIDNVPRDNPEEKLDDFLDRGVKVGKVIEHQHRILTESKFKRLIGFLTMNEWWWWSFSYATTILINVLLLAGAHDGNEEIHYYLTESTRKTVDVFGAIHLFWACLLLVNYWVGTARVNVQNGMTWRNMVNQELISIPYGKQAEMIFQTMDAMLPDYTWYAIFIFADKSFVWRVVYLVMSILGFAVNPYFFAFHVLDITTKLQVLTYVLNAVVSNGYQVGSTLFLGVMCVYIASVIVINRWGFDVLEYGDGGGDWNSLLKAFGQGIDYGLRGPPVFDFNNAEVYIFDFFYNIIIILIMVAIITGIIIDTFAEMRQQKNEIRNNTKNVCFICSQAREVFERHRIKFADHLRREHNMWNYMFYKMYLDRKDDSELSGMETYLKDLMAKQKITYFPNGKALCLANIKIENDEIDQLKESIQNMDNKFTGDISSIKNSLDEMKNMLNSIMNSQSSTA